MNQHQIQVLFAFCFLSMHMRHDGCYNCQVLLSYDDVTRDGQRQHRAQSRSRSCTKTERKKASAAPLASTSSSSACVANRLSAVAGWENGLKLWCSRRGRRRTTAGVTAWGNAERRKSFTPRPLHRRPAQQKARPRARRTRRWACHPCRCACPWTCGSPCRTWRLRA